VTPQIQRRPTEGTSLVDYRIRWADLGPYTHAALGLDRDKRLLVINTRDVPAEPEMALLLRQSVDVAAQSPLGRALIADKQRTLLLFARLESQFLRERSQAIRLRSQAARAKVGESMTARA
jgi:hypothetical protein